MKNKIIINGREIGENFPPYIIAELSANHNGDLNAAFNLIRLAKLAGADAVKIQSYTPDTITLDVDSKDFYIEDGLWKGKTLYQLYKEAYMPWEWHSILFDYAKKIGITIFSSPFDESAVDLLEGLGAPAYKIASFEAVDLPLIKYVAKTKKPMIISTGMANIEEIQEAIDAAREGGCEEIAILHCVSGYPASAIDYKLKTVPDLIKRFNLVTGLSDHTIENTTAIASIALGVSIIEKHFTINRNGGGPDDSFSIEPFDLMRLCKESRLAWDSLGEVDYGLKLSESGNIKYRRSLYFVKKMQKGEVIKRECIRSVRPGYGLAPKNYDGLLGRRVLKDIEYGTPTSWDLICKDD